MLSVAHWISFSNPPLTAKRKSQDFLFVVYGGGENPGFVIDEVAEP